MKSITAGYLTVLILFITSFLTGCGNGGSEGVSYWNGDSGASASPQISLVSDLDAPGQPVRVGDWIQIQ